VVALHTISLRAVVVMLCVPQWNFAQERISPRTFVALLDVAPLLGLVPSLCCYCFALSAALQHPREHQRRMLHGAKLLRAVCTIFTRISIWYGELRHRGPWSFDWQPPMAQVVRDWSSSLLVAVCLEDSERIPEDADVEQALAHVEKKQAAGTEAWRTLQAKLRGAHAQLDASLSSQRIQTLADVLACMVAELFPPKKKSKQ
jgi:hypothetical protein